MLTARQLLILKIIIQHYTTYGEAIGSKSIVDGGKIQSSSATIRNEMSKLEKLGLIEKTHSSSGRVPTLRGYRYYVDYLLEPAELSESQLLEITNALTHKVGQIDDIVNISADVLSNLTNYTAIVLGPQAKDSVLTQFQLIPLAGNQVMAILQTDKDTVESIVFKVPSSVNAEDIKKVSNLFNEQIVNLPLFKVAQKIQKDLPVLVKKYINSQAGMILPNIEPLIQNSVKNHIHISGKTNIFDFSDDLDKSQVKELYRLLDSESLNLEHLVHFNNHDVNIVIGNEMNDELLSDFSLITAPYSVLDYGQGMIAILGPTSMPYSKTLGLMEGFRSELVNTLIKYYLQ